MNAEKPTRKGPWWVRFGVKVLAVALAVLLFWLLDFVVRDLGSIRGPDYEAIEKEHVDQALLDRQEALEVELRDHRQGIEHLTRRKKALDDSTSGVRQTLGQLIELQRLSLTNQQTLTAEQQKAFEKSTELFLANQATRLDLDDQINARVSQGTQLEQELEDIRKQLEEQRKPARKEFDELRGRHRRRVAALKLVVLIPLLLIASFLVVKKRGTGYAPVFYAFGAAVLAKVAEVVHAYFPSRVFKYILILVLIGVVLKLMQLLIKAVIAPGKASLTKQYRDAYERFLCPVCEHPIRRGPLKFRYWTRRTAKKLAPGSGADVSAVEEDYTCPACGTVLFGECDACHRVRHRLLPYCEHCGDEVDLPS